MPKYVIERNVPDAAELTASQLQGLAAKSNEVLAGFDHGIQWVHSYVVDHRLYCVYNADDAELIREHGRRGGFPCDDIRQVSAIIDPVTGEASS